MVRLPSGQSEMAWVYVTVKSGIVMFQVNVEQADMEEISPAAPLLNRAATLSPSEYQQAKDLFLTGLESAGIQAQVGCSLLCCLNLFLLVLDTV